MEDKPKYPLTIYWPDEEPEVVQDEDYACRNLEWFDSEDLDEPVVVRDNESRRVRLKVVALKIEACELRD